ncbi:MAG: ATP-binding protein [Chloroflexi bacterium]|nr:ATP-binding protein [Chloroflexota bacterium]
MISVPGNMPPAIRIREKLTRGLVKTSMYNYRGLAEAVFELVDNAVDEFDGKQGGDHLYIDIEIKKDEIVVENRGGLGMGPQELQDWLAWGKSNKADHIGEYGQGGKGAMGYIGDAWIVKTKRWDEEIVWELQDDHWSDVSSGEKEYDVIPNKSTKDLFGKGYCKFEIRKLHPRRQNSAKLKLHLGNVFRKLLAEGKISITMNKETIEPFKLPLYEAFHQETFDKKTSSGLRLTGWIGRLKRDHSSKGGLPIRGGMRLLRKGRLICDGEFFGHPGPSYKQSLNTLIGEVEMPSKKVEGVPVLPNKTDFDRESSEWQQVEMILKSVLDPHIKELLNKADEDTVNREERKRLNDVRRVMAKAIETIAEEHGNLSSLGEGRGRKPPQTGNGKSDGVPGTDGTHIPKNPKTPAPPGGVGRLKRLGSMPPWELRVLDSQIRSTWEDNKQQRLLIINKTFPLYKEWKGHDLYIAETAALELARADGSETITVKEHQDQVNQILIGFCRLWSSGEA